LKNKKKNIQSMDQITPLRMSNGRMEPSGGEKKEGNLLGSKKTSMNQLRRSNENVVLCQEHDRKMIVPLPGRETIQK
jgi:hypothetical protein